jgi:hypothetical protein
MGFAAGDRAGSAGVHRRAQTQHRFLSGDGGGMGQLQAANAVETADPMRPADPNMAGREN